MEGGPSFFSQNELPLLHQLHQQLQHALNCLQNQNTLNWLQIQSALDCLQLVPLNCRQIQNTLNWLQIQSDSGHL